MDIIRIWTEIDTDEIKESIIIVDDKFGFCPACKEMGIKLEGLSNCPQCKREFKYITSRDARGGSKAIEFIRRVRKKLPDLTFVEYNFQAPS